MIEVDIDKWQIEYAKREAKNLGKLKNSITNGKRNVIGFIGETMIAKYLNILNKNTYEYDLVYNGLRLEVKTKGRNVKPKDHYNATVAAFNKPQDCDYYVFNSILNDYSKGWICGYISKNGFYEMADFNKDGEKETDIFNFKANCYNLQYNKLNSIEVLR